MQNINEIESLNNVKKDGSNVVRLQIQWIVNMKGKISQVNIPSSPFICCKSLLLYFFYIFVNFRAYVHTN